MIPPPLESRCPLLIGIYAPSNFWGGPKQTEKVFTRSSIPAKFLKAEKGSADLVVKVFAADGSLLAASPVLFNAPPSAEVDITIPAEVRQPPSLFEKIGQALEPLLGRLKVEELEEDKRHQDLSFLSGETGFDKSVLARFVMAHKLAQRIFRRNSGLLFSAALFPLQRRSKPQRTVAGI